MPLTPEIEAIINGDKPKRDLTKLDQTLRSSKLETSPIWQAECIEYAILHNAFSYLDVFLEKNFQPRSSFMIKNHKDFPSSIWSKLERAFYLTSSNPPDLSWDKGRYKVSLIERWLAHDFNLIKNPKFLIQAIAHGSFSDLTLLINCEAKLPKNLKEVFIEGRFSNTFWPDKLKFLAKLGITERDANTDLFEYLLKSGYADNNEIPYYHHFITAYINWTHQTSDDNDNSKKSIPSTYLIDHLIKANPKLIKFIPNKVQHLYHFHIPNFDINMIDAEGKSFLHKVVLGDYTTDPNKQVALLEIFFSLEIDPTLKDFDNLTAYQVAYQLKRGDLTHPLANYQINTHGNFHEEDSLQSQTSAIRKKMEENSKAKEAFDGLQNFGTMLISQIKEIMKPFEDRLTQIETKIIAIENQLNISGKPLVNKIENVQLGSTNNLQK